MVLARRRHTWLSLALLAVAVAGAGAAPAPARAASPAEIADSLRDDPVYVDPRAEPRLSPSAAARVRQRIARAAAGRVKVAVVAERDVERRGGLAGFTNAIAARLELRGAAIATAGGSYYAVTSHPAVEETIAALRAAVEGREPDELARQLVAAVEGVAEVDPGTDGPPRAPPPGSEIDVEEQVDEIFGAFKLGVVLVALAIALPFVVLAFVLVLRTLRRRRAREAPNASFDPGGGM